MELQPPNLSLERLSRQAEINSFRPEDIPWEQKVDASIRWVPDSFLAASYLPSVSHLSKRAWIRYNHMYAQAICEQFAWLEDAVIHPILESVLAKVNLPRGLKNNLVTFMEEEKVHSEVFWRLLEKTSPGLYREREYRYINLGRSDKVFIGAMIKYPAQLLAWIWMVLYLEERTIDISFHYKEAVRREQNSVDPLFAHIHYLHMVDEARHVQIDQYLLNYFYSKAGKGTRYLCAKMVEKIFAAYASPKRAIVAVLGHLKNEFTEEANIIDHLIAEVPTLGSNRKFQMQMFNNRSVGRTRRLLAQFPEMQRALQILTPENN